MPASRATSKWRSPPPVPKPDWKGRIRADQDWAYLNLRVAPADLTCRAPFRLPAGCSFSSSPSSGRSKATRELKRKTFPPALFSMLIGIAAAAAGAGGELRAWPWYVHMTLGLLTLLVNLWAFRIELRNVTTNAGVIDAVMREVDRIRAEQGLASNEEMLARRGICCEGAGWQVE